MARVISIVYLKPHLQVKIVNVLLLPPTFPIFLSCLRTHVIKLSHLYPVKKEKFEIMNIQ